MRIPSMHAQASFVIRGIVRYSVVSSARMSEARLSDMRAMVTLRVLPKGCMATCCTWLFSPHIQRTAVTQETSAGVASRSVGSSPELSAILLSPVSSYGRVAKNYADTGLPFTACLDLDRRHVECKSSSSVTGEILQNFGTR